MACWASRARTQSWKRKAEPGVRRRGATGRELCGLRGARLQPHRLRGHPGHFTVAHAQHSGRTKHSRHAGPSRVRWTHSSPHGRSRPSRSLLPLRQMGMRPCSEAGICPRSHRREPRRRDSHPRLAKSTAQALATRRPTASLSPKDTGTAARTVFSQDGFRIGRVRSSIGPHGGQGCGDHIPSGPLAAGARVSTPAAPGGGRRNSPDGDRGPRGTPCPLALHFRSSSLSG